MEIVREKILAISLIIALVILLLFSRRHHTSAESDRKIELTMKTADRMLAEEVVITTASLVIRGMIKTPSHVSFHWSNIPTLLLRLRRYCLDRKLQFITLGQLRFNLIHLAVACNFRDSMAPLDELFDQLNVALRHNEIDETTTMNVYRVIDGILQYVKPSLPMANP